MKNTDIIQARTNDLLGQINQRIIDLPVNSIPQERSVLETTRDALQASLEDIDGSINNIVQELTKVADMYHQEALGLVDDLLHTDLAAEVATDGALQVASLAISSATGIPATAVSNSIKTALVGVYSGDILASISPESLMPVLHNLFPTVSMELMSALEWIINQFYDSIVKTKTTQDMTSLWRELQKKCARPPSAGVLNNKLTKVNSTFVSDPSILINPSSLKTIFDNILKSLFNKMLVYLPAGYNLGSLSGGLTYLVKFDYIDTFISNSFSENSVWLPAGEPTISNSLSFYEKTIGKAKQISANPGGIVDKFVYVTEVDTETDPSVLEFVWIPVSSSGNMACIVPADMVDASNYFYTLYKDGSYSGDGTLTKTLEAGKGFIDFGITLESIWNTYPTTGWNVKISKKQIVDGSIRRIPITQWNIPQLNKRYIVAGETVARTLDIPSIGEPPVYAYTDLEMGSSRLSPLSCAMEGYRTSIGLSIIGGPLVCAMSGTVE